ncbi:choice-of-anchor P family protein [Thermomonospora amylolytica]|uniref:choice-of-anchor P family protein n=1 Tax=Thermomonospora amylolytica TaxID=1411117 RepID=UPI000E6B98D2|nr:choice-of-anchor P family protein [Thermomonospora amylolytica]
MQFRKLTTGAALAGMVAAPLVVAATPAYAAPGGKGSAHAVAATGLVDIPATPAVASSARRPVSRSVAELPANPLVRASVLSAAAGAGQARAGVADLAIARLGLTAEAVTAKCVNGRGASNLAKATLRGKSLRAAAAPNTGVTVGLDGVGTASVVLNKQVRRPGGGLTVTAIEVTLPPVAGKTQTISIASATCAPGGGKSPAPTGPDRTPPVKGTPTAKPSPSVPAVQAPSPKPVPGDLPVTG